MIEHEITSIGEFLDARREDIANGMSAVWYRGHSNWNWDLVPGFYRTTHAVSESTLMARFKQSAAMLTEITPKNDFDWLFVMQHYGVPTRLLDWTESPLVALYFAVENEISDDIDSALWCLSPSKLNLHANIADENEADYVPSFEDDVIQGYSPNDVRQNNRLQLKPVATIATRNNARIQAQAGTFTIHHGLRMPIDQVGDRSHVAKYRIPNKSRSHLMNELRMLGVNRFSLFPELSSVGRIISESIA